MLVWRDAIKPYVCDVSKFLNDAIKLGKKILLEGIRELILCPGHPL